MALKKIIYFAQPQKHIKEGSGSGRIQFFLGHPDPNPKKNEPDPLHWFYEPTTICMTKPQN